jgi:hypothetical protein
VLGAAGVTTGSVAASVPASGATGSGAGSAAFLAAFLAVFFAGASPAPAAGAGKASFSFLMTGASTVEDAERTNSPMSFSLATTSLDSTPNSRASS